MSFPDSSLRVELLGPVSIRVGAARRGVVSARQRAVLGLLALRTGTPVMAEELIDEIWGGMPPGKVRNALQATVTRLRRTIRPVGGSGSTQEVIHTSEAGYVLQLPKEAIDVHSFTALCDVGRRLARSSPSEAIATLEKALSLWRGAALSDAGGGRRCVAAGVRLEELRMVAQEELLALQIESGQSQRALGPLRELTVRFPERERLCVLLMVALHGTGRQVEALGEFERIRQCLSRELGLEPGEQLHRLRSEILRGDSFAVTQGIRRDLSSSRAATAFRSAVPAGGPDDRAVGCREGLGRSRSSSPMTRAPR